MKLREVFHVVIPPYVNALYFCYRIDKWNDYGQKLFKLCRVKGDLADIGMNDFWDVREKYFESHKEYFTKVEDYIYPNGEMIIDKFNPSESMFKKAE